MLTQEILKSILTYEEETGIFRRKQPASNMTVGSVAGSLGKNGWIRIKINNKRYAAHKLAWLYVYGEFPKMDIDHRNRIRSDNRIRNLRLATKNQNQHNQTLSTASSTRLKGVTLHKKSGKYQAQIKHFGKKIYLGLYATSEGASVAYEAASRKLFGQFSYNA